MVKQSQKEAVYSAVMSVLGEQGVSVTEGSDISSLMSRELRSQVSEILVEGFKNGSIELNKTFSDSELRTYVSGLQSNWLKKDKRLNGGTQYVAKNPGSRAGSSDPQLKALRSLLSALTDETERLEVQSHIDARSAELAAQKVTKSIDRSAIPAELLTKLGM